MRARVLMMLLACAAPMAASTLDDEVKISLAAVSGSQQPDGAYRPREGFPCRLQVTVENRSKNPLVLYQLAVRSDGVVNAVRDDGELVTNAAREDFHTSQIFCEQIEEHGDALKLEVRFSERFGAIGADAKTPPLAVTGGANTTRLNRVTEDGIVMPGRSVRRTFAWIPVKADGSLTFEASAVAGVLKWSPALARAVWLLDPGQSIPARPSWMVSGVVPDPQPEVAPFWVTFTRPHQWPAEPDFTGALIDRGASSAIVEVQGANRIVAEPGDPPLKSLLVQTRAKPARAVYAPSARAWFLGSEEHTWIVTPTRRLELRQDVSEFMLERVHGGMDASPWEIDLDAAGEMAIRLAGHPVAPATRNKKKRAMVPPAALIDRLADADRIGLKPAGDGFTKK